MKKKYKIIFPLIIVAGMLFGFQIANNPDPEKDKILIGLVRYALKQGHYEPHQIDDNFSEKIFTDFIDALDPYKRFFLISDIEEFSVYEHLIDDQIKSEDLTFYNMVMDRFKQRVLESQSFYREILKNPFGWRNHKGRCLFVGKGAEAFIIGATLLQGDKIGDHLHNVGPLKYLIYGLLVNHLPLSSEIKNTGIQDT